MASPRVVSSLLSLSLVGMACSSVESSDIKTSGMSATFTAVTEGGSTKAEGVLRVGGGLSTTFVNLTGEDQLSASAANQTVVLTKNNLGNYYFYTGTLAASAAGTQVVFAFQRSATDVSAPSSKVTLPNPFNLTAPGASAVLHRSQPLTVTWDSAANPDAMTLDLAGECVLPVHVDISGDPGTYVVEAGQIKPTSDEHAADSCSATLTLARSRSGTLDQAFGEGGSVRGIQQRSVSIRLDP